MAEEQARTAAIIALCISNQTTGILDWTICGASQNDRESAIEMLALSWRDAGGTSACSGPSVGSPIRGWTAYLEPDQVAPSETLFAGFFLGSRSQIPIAWRTPLSAQACTELRSFTLARGGMLNPQRTSSTCISSRHKLSRKFCARFLI